MEGFENANPTFQMPQKGRKKDNNKMEKRNTRKAQHSLHDKIHKKHMQNIDFQLSQQIYHITPPHVYRNIPH